MSKELVFGIGVFMISFFMRTVVDNYDKEGRINDILNGWIGDILEVIFEPDIPRIRSWNLFSTDYVSNGGGYVPPHTFRMQR